MSGALPSPGGERRAPTNAGLDLESVAGRATRQPRARPLGGAHRQCPDPQRISSAPLSAIGEAATPARRTVRPCCLRAEARVPSNARGGGGALSLSGPRCLLAGRLRANTNASATSEIVKRSLLRVDLSGSRVVRALWDALMRVRRCPQATAGLSLTPLRAGVHFCCRGAEWRLGRRIWDLPTHPSWAYTDAIESRGGSRGQSSYVAVCSPRWRRSRAALRHGAAAGRQLRAPLRRFG